MKNSNNGAITAWASAYSADLCQCFGCHHLSFKLASAVKHVSLLQTPVLNQQTVMIQLLTILNVCFTYCFFSCCALSLFAKNAHLWDKAAFLVVCLAQHNHVWGYLSQYKHYLNGKDWRQTENSVHPNKRRLSKYQISGKDHFFQITSLRTHV